MAIVTPSYQQARYLGEAIESVLAQSYPAIDYLVVDGGSTDGSVDLLRAYGERVAWISERDRGQADAIAKGFARTRGEILAWINSDDRLLPGAVARAVEVFRAHPGAGLVYANGLLLDQAGRSTGPFPWIEPFDLWRLIHFSDYVLQPAAFFRRAAYDAAGGLDTSLHYAMDWDLWIRLAGAAEVVYLEGELLACSRVWSDAKTSTGGWRRIAELARLAQKHTGRRLTPAVQRYALDTLGRQLRRTLPRCLFRAAVAVGARVDARILRRMAAHADGWLGPRGELVFPRRWRRAAIELELPELPGGAASPLRVLVDGEPAAVDGLARPGRHRLVLAARAAGDSPFCTVQLHCARTLREPGTGRRLAVRVLGLTPA